MKYFRQMIAILYNSEEIPSHTSKLVRNLINIQMEHFDREAVMDPNKPRPPNPNNLLLCDLMSLNINMYRISKPIIF